MRQIRCRNCGALSELPDYHGALLVVCPHCEWQETHPARRHIAPEMEGQASAAYRAHEAQMAAAEARLERVRTLSPHDFVRFCAELFEHAGYEATPSDNEAYALELRRGEERVYAACDLRSGERSIEPEELETLSAVLRHDRVDRGIFVTTGQFADACERAATAAGIELLDGAGLQHKIVFADAERLDAWLAERAP